MLGKRQRLDEIILRLSRHSPFSDGDQSRLVLAEIIRTVEDEMTNIPENPDAAISPPDGRIYAPHDLFEKSSSSPRVRLFKQSGHSTLFCDNGSLKIVRADGEIEVDRPGTDGKTIHELITENEHEPD